MAEPPCSSEPCPSTLGWRSSWYRTSEWQPIYQNTKRLQFNSYKLLYIFQLLKDLILDRLQYTYKYIANLQVASETIKCSKKYQFNKCIHVDTCIWCIFLRNFIWIYMYYRCSRQKSLQYVHQQEASRNNEILKCIILIYCLSYKYIPNCTCTCLYRYSTLISSFVGSFSSRNISPKMSSTLETASAMKRKHDHFHKSYIHVQ